MPTTTTTSTGAGDVTLTCLSCRTTFVWTADAQRKVLRADWWCHAVRVSAESLPGVSADLEAAKLTAAGDLGLRVSGIK